jgi:uncharacterized protein
MENTSFLRSLERETRLLPGEPMTRRDRNRAYMMRLDMKNLLFSHYAEAGLLHATNPSEIGHWGWDAPTSHMRGVVAGHWLSAASRIISETGDAEMKLKADRMVSEIASCQKENGGEWAFPIPEKYLHWLRQGKSTWAPQYVCHKTMMGLLDMALIGANEQAMDVVLKCAEWFYRFTGDITREEMNNMMDLQETGGMMEHWANLYAATGDARHLEIMRRYERPRLFDPLYKGDDVLTNMHANATIPEVHGAARAYEVTGEERYRRIAMNYWDLAIRKRGVYVTGGQTCGEVWTPIMRQSARLSDLNQEHCTVYNLMRLSGYLYRWTGDSEYADFWERNLYNGIFAQGYWKGRSLDIRCEPPVPPTGLISYFLPLAPGSQKKWGTETDHFWCCHCTLLQANANFHESIYFQNESGIVIAQYLPSRVTIDLCGNNITIEQELDMQTDSCLSLLSFPNHVQSRPDEIRVRISVKAETPASCMLKFRRPWWLKDTMRCLVNGQEIACDDDGKGNACITRQWDHDEILLVMKKGLTCWPLPDRPDMVAFLDGPVALAGLVGEERLMYGRIEHPEDMLIPDEERQWSSWGGGWRTAGQPVGWKFKPLYRIGNEIYTVYFPVRDLSQWQHE